jgi:hypothetical protein
MILLNSVNCNVILYFVLVLYKVLHYLCIIKIKQTDIQL